MIDYTGQLDTYENQPHDILEYLDDVLYCTVLFKWDLYKTFVLRWPKFLRTYPCRPLKAMLV